MNPDEVAAMIDHAQLKPEATSAMIDRLCEEAGQYRFGAVCVNPVWVARCQACLAGSGVRVASVVGFPFGAHRTATKIDETIRAIDDGACEVDMVIQLGALIAGEVGFVREDIAAVAEAAHTRRTDAVVKVILEAGALTDEQIVTGCRCAVEANADFVKTSTGFHPSGGAKIEHVRLMRAHAGPLQVKASGGIRTARDLLAMVEAGATRIGGSTGPAIMDELCAGQG